MSQVGDTSNPSPSGVTPRSNSCLEVASNSSAMGDASSTKRLRFNEHGLPVGDNSATPSTRWGYLARTYVPVSYTTWRHVDARYKNQIWTMFKKDFPDVKENQKSMFMKKANESWKKFKAKIRANLKGDDVTKWRENVPQNVKPEDWEVFCGNEAVQAQKDLRKKNKEKKQNCVKTTTHNTGRYGYARAAENWKNEHGCKPTRANNESWKHHVDNLREEMEGVKSTLSEFVKNFESGKFACIGHNTHALPSPNTATPFGPFTPPTSQVSSFSSMVECKILSHTGQVVGYGRKLPLGAVSSVHFHDLGKREVKIVLDLIKVPEYPVWGGKQGSYETLGDVGNNGFLYWHDDFLPPIDDTNE